MREPYLEIDGPHGWLAIRKLTHMEPEDAAALVDAVEAAWKDIKKEVTMVATTMLVVETLVTDGLGIDMNRHNMNEWDIPVPEIMHRMEEARLELDNSTGDFVLGQDTRYVTGQFLLRTDGMFEQHGLPDLLFGNVPYPFVESAGTLLGILGATNMLERMMWIL